MGAGVVVRPLSAEEIARTAEVPAEAIERYVDAGMTPQEALTEAAEFDSGGLHLTMEQYADLHDGRRIQTDAAHDGFEIHTLDELQGERDPERIAAALKRAMRLDTAEDRWRRLALALARQGIEVSPAEIDSRPFAVEVDFRPAPPLPDGM